MNRYDIETEMLQIASFLNMLGSMHEDMIDISSIICLAEMFYDKAENVYQYIIEMLDKEYEKK